MKKFLLFISIASFLGACSSGNHNSDLVVPPTTDSTTAPKDSVSTTTTEETPVASSVEQLQMGMKADTVIILLGEPTKKETQQSDPKISVEDWWYGENQKVRMINGKVNHVVKDVAKEQDLLKQLVAAKKKGDEAEVTRLMNELTQE